jgi:hypothetical protein
MTFIRVSITWGVIVRWRADMEEGAWWRVDAEEERVPVGLGK